MRTSTTASLSQSVIKSSVWAAIFVAANLLLPQLFHKVALSGQEFLPIMLFTIIAALLFGVRSAMAVAILSPLASMAIFGMPSPQMTTILIIKGAAVVAALAYARHHFGKVTLLSLLASIAAYQVVGAIVASLVFSLSEAINMVLISWPAVAIQLIVGYIVIKKFVK